MGMQSIGSRYTLKNSVSGNLHLPLIETLFFKTVTSELTREGCARIYLVH